MVELADGMIFWIAAGILTIVTVVGGLWPLLRGGRRLSALEHAVAFYEERRRELERQEANGEITGDERLAAETEQARRLIALDRQAGGDGEKQPDRVMRRRKFAAATLLLGVPALALPIYLALGQPGMRDLPLAARKVDPQGVAIADAVRRIEAHLARNPNDGKGFDVVAPVYLRAGRFDDASRAYRRAIELLGATPTRLADLGESLVAAGHGVVSAEARAAFEQSVQLDPSYAKSRFYLALGLEQDGQVLKAFEAYVALADGLDDPAARQRVMVEIERLRASGKIPPDTPGPRAAPSGPAGTIAALPEAERAAAIRGMVEGLASRLESGGGTLVEWQRLIQARMVLNERDKAEAHLAAARKALAADAVALAELDRLAQSLGFNRAP